ncbi:MAG: hypothetical protein CUN55_09725 [Phototrophicales bacterium]|nr:MAG: hypothetical protein CUN55_09725 [Phototrophicales bacterium]
MPLERTLIILNPHAGSGRAGRLWQQIEPLLWERLGELVIAVTQHPDDVAEHLDKAQSVGITKVVAIGGDGTNHAIINAIQQLALRNPELPPMTYAQLPIGTGQDFARTLNIPTVPELAVEWIANAQPAPIDLGLLHYENQKSYQRYFLNIASVGVGGEVDRRVNRLKKRRAWSFKVASIQSLLTFRPPRLKVWLDEKLWYDDKSWIVVIANGKIFGHGMKIAPHARLDDGLFDVILVGDVSRYRTIRAFNTVYSGRHLEQNGVYYQKAQRVRIENEEGLLGLDMDGEYVAGTQLQFEVRPAALHMLVGKGAL